MPVSSRRSQRSRQAPHATAPAASPSGERSKDNTPMILGICIAAGVLVIAVAAFIMLSNGPEEITPESGTVASTSESTTAAESSGADLVATGNPASSSTRPRTTAAGVVPISTVAAGKTAGIPTGSGDQTDDIATYVGGEGNQQLTGILRLSDGSFLVGGGATKMDWLPAGVPTVELGGEMPEPENASGQTAFLLHLDAEGEKIQRVYTLKAGAAADISLIRATSAPGEKTGDLFISGSLPKEGYFIARLDGNIVSKPLTRLIWAEEIGDAALAKTQPWDVGPDGRVIYARGNPYSYNWFALYVLDPNGEQTVMEHWRRHWVKKPDGSLTEWAGSPASKNPIGEAQFSAIVLKVWGRGDFRSWNEEDFKLITSDGNGGKKQGKWPFDAMFPGYFDNETGKDVKLYENGRGYYGYRWGTTPCANVFAIAIDRRTGEFYIAGNNKSKLPGGNPDFEPWVVAMSPTGELRWWQRLYSEEAGVSTPDQYVDGLAIDYSVPIEQGGAITVLARAHGNNVNNLWTPKQIKHPGSNQQGFQPQFTGTHGNMHFSWLGKLALDQGTLLACTYFAEYGEGAKHGDRTFDEPLLDHWPHWLAGWPDLNTTRFRNNTLHVDAKGNVYVAALGRRVITTKNAHMEMPSPTQHPGSKGQWSDFVRCYTPDLVTLKYSSLVAGKWDWETGKGGSDHEISGITPIPGGVMVVGFSKLDKSGSVSGDDMPTKNVPDWGKPTRIDQIGVLQKLHFQQ